MNTRTALKNEENSVLSIEEDHFHDLKSRDIAPAKLQETFVAFANADGGELWIGVEDSKYVGHRLRGFVNREDANNIIHTLLETTKPSVEYVELEFIDFASNGYVLHINIPKSPKVHYCANDDCYIRINARKDKIKGDRILQLGYAKGAFVYEKQPVDIAQISDFIDSELLIDYMNKVGSSLEPEKFLRKQRLITLKQNDWKPNVACVLMFDEEPQATLDTRCAIKIYRLLTSEADYKREQLQTLPKTIGGTIEEIIHKSIAEVQSLLKDSSVEIDGELQKLDYPSKAIHEILVNAVIHRDYSLNDDIHLKIFDNRIEVISPGKLPGYITPANIYDERFSRNPNLVRLLHNLPNPVNHDIGEGLNTAKNEMNKFGLVDPIIQEEGNNVKVTIKHKKIATLEDIIIKYLTSDPNKTITNRTVREISGEDDVNKVKKAFQKLRNMNKIEPVDKNANAFNFAYKLIQKES